MINAILRLFWNEERLIEHYARKAPLGRDNPYGHALKSYMCPRCEAANYMPYPTRNSPLRQCKKCGTIFETRGV